MLRELIESLNEGLSLPKFDKLDAGREAYYTSLVSDYGKFKKKNKTVAQIKNGKLTKPLEKELTMMKEYGATATSLARVIEKFVPMWNDFSKKIDSSDKSEWKAIAEEYIPQFKQFSSVISISDVGKWESKDYLWIRAFIGSDAKKFMMRYSTTKGSFYHQGQSIGTAYANKNHLEIKKAAESGLFDWSTELSMAQYAECYDWQSIMFVVETIKKTQLRVDKLHKEGKGYWDY